MSQGIVDGRPPKNKRTTGEFQIFDATIQIIGVDVLEAEDHVTPLFTAAIGLPAGPGQILPIPAANLRFPMRKEVALEFAQKLQEAAEKLSDTPGAPKSDLVIANSMQGIDKVAQTDQKFRGQ